MGHEIKDTLVIYQSEEDQCWVAHSLRTDQIGTGDRIVDAIADVLQAIDQLCKLVRDDSSIQLYREAPANILKIAEQAKTLPAEIYEIAHRKVHGTWPDYVKPDFTVEGEAFTSEVTECASC